MRELIELTSANGDSRVVASTFGGRVISWKHRGREVIFRNATLELDEFAASHCGVPILFPQFGKFGDGEKHGFVRNAKWKVESASRDQCILIFSTDETELANSELQQFVVRVIVQLDDDRLRIWLQTENTSPSDSLTFTAGLHTYLAVNDVSSALLTGLQGANFLDVANDLAPSVDLSSHVVLGAEVDRVYVDTPMPISLDGASFKLTIDQQGFEDTVVWNPGEKLAQTFADLGVDEWRKFVCIEAAQIQNPVNLQPGETWTGSQTLTVR